MSDASRRRELGAALASAFLAGAWSERAILSRAAEVLEPRPRWLRPVVRRVHEAYPRPPADRPRELATFIARILERYETRPQVRRWRDFEARMGRVRWHVPEITSPGALADLLELDAGQLMWLADARGLQRGTPDRRLRHYTYRWPPRRGAPPRPIARPKLRLKEIQRWILHAILDEIPQHDAAHGFVRGRSARTHAALHAGRATIVRLDLEDFFASVPAGRVYGILRAAGYPEAVAHTLTALCVTVVPRSEWAAVPLPEEPALLARHARLGRRLATPHLPQGAPTSPALASLGARRLDVRLAGLAAALGARYSRYADDLTFSGDEDLPAGTLRRAVTSIARDEGFGVAAGKSSVRRRHERQVVCGVVVNRHPNVARDEYDRLKAIIHDAARNGAEQANRDRVADFRAHLQGRIAWVAQLNPARGRRLQARFDAIAW